MTPRRPILLTRAAAGVLIVLAGLAAACTAPAASTAPSASTAASPSEAMMEASASPSEAMMESQRLAQRSDDGVQCLAQRRDDGVQPLAIVTIAIGFAFVAGVLTILAPCTLPVVPLVLGGATSGGAGAAARLGSWVCSPVSARASSWRPFSCRRSSRRSA